MTRPEANPYQRTYGQDNNPAAFNMLCLYAPQAVVADYFFQEIGARINWESIKSTLRNLFTGREEAATLRDRVEETLGVELPIEYEAVPEMLEEVRRFKWLEAERADRDIWAEQHPADPEAHALRTWFQKHFGAWYLARKARA